VLCSDSPVHAVPDVCRSTAPVGEGAQVFFYNLMGWPLPVDPKKEDDKALEDAAATKKLTGGTEGSEVRRRKTTGGVTKVESMEQWKALLQVCVLGTCRGLGANEAIQPAAGN
jgi:hypothetical protein